MSFNSNKFYGTVTLNKGLGDRVYLVAWRPAHKSSKSVQFIPYHLANYIGLVHDGKYHYTGLVYMFTHKELDGLEVGGEIKSIKRTANGAIITLDLRNLN